MLTTHFLIIRGLMDRADRVSWYYLIKEGSVVTGWSYYGNRFEIDAKATKRVKKLIDIVGISWKHMRPVEEEEESSFAGTFAEHSEYTPVLRGNLILNNGKKYAFGLSGALDLKDLINFVLENSDELY